MEGEIPKQKESVSYGSILLELAAFDDQESFEHAVNVMGCDIDGVSSWYGRKHGSKEIGLIDRTPLMIPATYGNLKVLQYILESHRVDVLRASVSDGATALKCAEANGSSDEIVDLLCLASKNATAALEKQPGKFFPPVTNSCSSSRNEPQEILQTGAGNYKSYELFPPLSDLDSSSTYKLQEILIGAKNIGKGYVGDGQNHRQTGEQHQQMQNFKNLKGKTVMEGDQDGSLTDEFMVYSFKVEQCPEIHCGKNQKDCPFLHHGEKRRRRDPIKHSYEPILCPRFKEGTCDQGDACRSAHGKFEVRFHPKRYRRKFCDYGLGCSKKFCSFAHDEDQFRTSSPSRTAHEKSSVPPINQSLAHPGWNIPSHQQQQGNSMEETPSGSSQPICTNFLAPAADPAIPISDNGDFNVLGGDIYGNGPTCSSVTPQSLQALPLNNVAPPARTHSSTIGRENQLSNLTSSSSTSFPTWVPTTFHDEGLPNLEQTDTSYQAPNMGMINSTSPRLSNNDSSIGGGISNVLLWSFGPGSPANRGHTDSHLDRNVSRR